VNVALDAQLAIGTATGIGEYVRGLQSALRDAGVHVAALYEPRLDPWRFDRRVIWDQIVLPQRAAATHADWLPMSPVATDVQGAREPSRRTSTMR